MGNGLGTYTSANTKISKRWRRFDCGTEVAVYRCQVTPTWRYSDVMSNVFSLPERHCLEQAARVKLRFNAKKEQLIKLIALAQEPQSPGIGLASMLTVILGFDLD